MLENSILVMFWENFWTKHFYIHLKIVFQIFLKTWNPTTYFMKNNQKSIMLWNVSFQHLKGLQQFFFFQLHGFFMNWSQPGPRYFRFLSRVRGDITEFSRISTHCLGDDTRKVLTFCILYSRIERKHCLNIVLSIFSTKSRNREQKWNFSMGYI